MAAGRARYCSNGTGGNGPVCGFIGTTRTVGGDGRGACCAWRTAVISAVLATRATAVKTACLAMR
jgi:hypothetical protein